MLVYAVDTVAIGEDESNKFCECAVTEGIPYSAPPPWYVAKWLLASSRLKLAVPLVEEAIDIEAGGVSVGNGKRLVLSNRY